VGLDHLEFAHHACFQAVARWSAERSFRAPKARAHSLSFNRRGVSRDHRRGPGSGPAIVNVSKSLPQLDFVRSVAVLVVFARTPGTYTRLRSDRRDNGAFWRRIVLHTYCSRMFLSPERKHDDFVTFDVRRAFRIYPLSVRTIALVVLFHIPATSWSALMANLARLSRTLPATSL
jgi:hypothetical protein